MWNLPFTYVGFWYKENHKVDPYAFQFVSHIKQPPKYLS